MISGPATAKRMFFKKQLNQSVLVIFGKLKKNLCCITNNLEFCHLWGTQVGLLIRPKFGTKTLADFSAAAEKRSEGKSSTWQLVELT